MKRFLIVLLCLLLVCVSALSETVYVLCQPDSFVYVRMFPKRGAQAVGYAELGQALETDGEKRNGFMLVYGFEGESWINAGFVTRYPVTIETLDGWVKSSGRVVCRRSINGTRRKWLSDGTDVTIYARSDDWSITDKGFIQTAFLGGF